MKGSTLGWIKTDGLLHLETSALITIALSLFLPWWVAAVIAFLIGVVKELYDKEHGGVASWHDIGCDAAGVLIGLFLAWI